MDKKFPQEAPEWKKNLRTCIIIGIVMWTIVTIILTPIRLLTTGSILPVWIQRPSISQLRRCLNSNQDEFELIVDYFRNSEFERIVFRSTGRVFIDFETDTLTITDENVERAIENTFRRGYSLIDMNEYGVSFLRWSVRNHGRGIVFSFTGETPTESSLLQFLTTIEPLSIDGWYFYIEDFNEWRRR